MNQYETAADEFTNDYAARVAFEALMRRLMLTGLTSGWISVKERTPPADQPVLVWYRNALGVGKTTRAFYAPALHDSGDDAFAAENDLLVQGWWEDPTAGGKFFRIKADVEYWMPLPPGPVACVPGQPPIAAPANKPL